MPARAARRKTATGPPCCHARHLYASPARAGQYAAAALSKPPCQALLAQVGLPTTMLGGACARFAALLCHDRGSPGHVQEHDVIPVLEPVLFRVNSGAPALPLAVAAEEQQRVAVHRVCHAPVRCARQEGLAAPGQATQRPCQSCDWPNGACCHRAHIGLMALHGCHVAGQMPAWFTRGVLCQSGHEGEGRTAAGPLPRTGRQCRRPTHRRGSSPGCSLR